MARERRPLAEKLGAAGVEWLLAGMPAPLMRAAAVA